MTLELAEAIEAGDDACRQLGRRLDRYGMRLAAVRARLYRDAPAGALHASWG